MAGLFPLPGSPGKGRRPGSRRPACAEPPAMSRTGGRSSPAWTEDRAAGEDGEVCGPFLACLGRSVTERPGLRRHRAVPRPLWAEAIGRIGTAAGIVDHPRRDQGALPEEGVPEEGISGSAARTMLPAVRVNAAAACSEASRLRNGSRTR